MSFEDPFADENAICYNNSWNRMPEPALMRGRDVQMRPLTPQHRPALSAAASTTSVTTGKSGGFDEDFRYKTVALVPFPGTKQNLS